MKRKQILNPGSIHVCLMLGAVLVPSAAHANLDKLMKSLQEMPGLEANYVETKHIDLLAMPLVSEGRLRFLPSDRLARDTIKPFPSRTLIISDRLIIKEGKKTQEVNVGANPVVRAFIRSFVLLLAGDQTGLKSLYDLKYQSGKDGWSLELSPKAKSIKKIIRRISMKGSGTVLQNMRIDESSGDYSETVFTQVNVRRKYKPDEIEKYFSIKN